MRSISFWQRTSSSSLMSCDVARLTRLAAWRFCRMTFPAARAARTAAARARLSSDFFIGAECGRNADARRGNLRKGWSAGLRARRVSVRALRTRRARRPALLLPELHFLHLEVVGVFVEVNVVL